MLSSTTRNGAIDKKSQSINDYVAKQALAKQQAAIIKAVTKTSEERAKEAELRALARTGAAAAPFATHYNSSSSPTGSNSGSKSSSRRNSGNDWSMGDGPKSRSNTHYDDDDKGFASPARGRERNNVSGPSTAQPSSSQASIPSSRLSGGASAVASKSPPLPTANASRSSSQQNDNSLQSRTSPSTPFHPEPSYEALRQRVQSLENEVTRLKENEKTLISFMHTADAQLAQLTQLAAIHSQAVQNKINTIAKSNGSSTAHSRQVSNSLINESSTTVLIPTTSTTPTTAASPALSPDERSRLAKQKELERLKKIQQERKEEEEKIKKAKQQQQIEEEKRKRKEEEDREAQEAEEEKVEHRRPVHIVSTQSTSQTHSRVASIPLPTNKNNKYKQEEEEEEDEEEAEEEDEDYASDGVEEDEEDDNADRENANFNGEADPYANAVTGQCPNCGRSFIESVLAKHIAKNLCKPKTRKVFDMKKKRLEEVAKELVAAGASSTSGASNKKGAGEKPKVSKWRQERARLQEAIRAGKAISTAEAAGLPPPPAVASALPDDRVQCPYCSRKFEERTAERHIPHCKNANARIKPNQRNLPPTGRR